MPGRKRRKLNKLPAASAVKREVLTVKGNKTNEQPSWIELPEDLLELIITRLTLRENIRASVVCKQWFDVAISVRVVNKPPWLMFFPKSGYLVEFYDPLSRAFYALQLPELCGSRVCYSKDGWLLVYRPKTHQVMFVNPYTRELIELPNLELQYQIVAFSASPKSASCIVFTIRHVSPTIIAISTCCPGATEWTNISYRNRLPFVSSMWNKLVFCGDKFYCLSLTGWLGVYDPVKRSWVVHVLPPPKCPENFFVENCWKSKFMAEHNGEILVVYTSSEVNPVVYRLDLTIKEWVEIKNLGGLSIFASFLSCHARTDLLGTMRNSVYFTKVRYYGKRCISYSVDNNRYYPRKQYYDWGEENPFGSIWIEPPEDLSSFG